MTFLLYCFFFKVTPTTDIYPYGHTLSLHDALPICSPRPSSNPNKEERHELLSFHAAPSRRSATAEPHHHGADDAHARRRRARPRRTGRDALRAARERRPVDRRGDAADRKSTRLNSSH